LFGEGNNSAECRRRYDKHSRFRSKGRLLVVYPVEYVDGNFNNFIFGKEDGRV